MKRKRKNPIPILLLWSKKEQLRFCNAVEQAVSAARDLAHVVEQLRLERTLGTKRRASKSNNAKDTNTSSPAAAAAVAGDATTKEQTS